MQTTVFQLPAPTHQQRAGRPFHLTPRELQVLALLCEGLPNKLIGRRLNISAATVKCHISRILDELGVASRLQAVVAAARRGLVPDAPDATAQVRSLRETGSPGAAAARPMIAAIM